MWNSVKSRPYLAIILIYTLTHFWLPLNRGIYWDDWVWFTNIDQSREGFRELGSPFLGELYLFFAFMKNGVPLYKLLVFFCHLGISLLTLSIFRREELADDEDSFFIAALTAVLPLDLARVSLSVASYSVCLFLFVLGSWLLFARKGFLGRVLADLLLFCSFSMNSLLVFFIVPFGLLARSSKKSRADFLKANFDLICLPPLFWILKARFLAPSGVYLEYNQLNAFREALHCDNWLTALTDLYVTPFASLFGLAETASKIHEATFFFLAVLLIFLIKRNRWPKKVVVLSAGAALIFALLPYLIVGKVPRFFSWYSRHQIVAILPAAALLVFTLRASLAHLTAAKQTAVLWAIIALSAATTWSLYFEFERDWLKHPSLMANFVENTDIRDNQTFTVTDQTKLLSPPKVEFPFYAYSGMMAQVFKDQSRFAADPGDAERFLKDSSKLALTIGKAPRRYSLGDYKIGPIQRNIDIEEQGDWGIFNVSRLMFLEWFRPNDFATEIKPMLRLTVTPAGGS